MKFQIYLISILCMLTLINCNDDDTKITNDEPDPVLTDNVEVYRGDLIEDGFVLAVENGSDSSFFIDKAGNKIKDYNFDTSLGNDLELLENGKLLGIFKPENDPVFSFGGYGGLLD